jgi:uncharacterized membrane protein YgcG
LEIFMMRIQTTLSAMLGLATLVAVAPASGQNLSERINTVLEQRATKQATAKGPILRALLTTSISVKFQDTKAKEAFAYLKQLIGVEMVVRWSDDPGAGDGLDPEARLTFEMNSAQALVVLERMIDMSTTEPATWQLRQGYLEVGTKSRLNARGSQETRIYPIRDLLFEAPNFDNAPEFNLAQSVQTGGGGGGGGSGGGGGGFGGGGGGGGSGGGGGGGGGGVPFGTPGEPPERRAPEEKADQLIELIKSLVEPDVWLDDSVASIRYYDGSIIVRAPDYVQRQVAGYGSLPAEAPKRTGGRYVDMTAPIGVSKVTGFGTSTVTGSAGGGSTGTTGGAGGRGGAGSSGTGAGGGSFIPSGGAPTGPGGSGAKGSTPPPATTPGTGAKP